MPVALSGTQPMVIGHLPLRGVAIPPFYAGQIGAQAAQRVRQGLEVIPMHFGQPSEGASPSALSAARAHLEGRLEGPAGYWESAALRERIALHYREQHDIDIAPERILLTTGASAGLVATFTALFAAGDRVALARPGYPAYRNALRALGRVPVEVDCGPEHGFRLAPELLPCSSAPLQGLLVASPANPTGTVLGAPELTALAAECRRRGTRFVSDEIYHGIEYGRQAVTALQFEPEALVINSFSKLFRMPGWRIGWLVAPESCVGSLHSHLINFFLTPPAIAQHAALAAFDDLALLKRSVETYAANRARLLEALPIWVCRIFVRLKALSTWNVRREPIHRRQSRVLQGVAGRHRHRDRPGNRLRPGARERIRSLLVRDLGA